MKKNEERRKLSTYLHAHESIDLFISHTRTINIQFEKFNKFARDNKFEGKEKEKKKTTFVNINTFLCVSVHGLKNLL